MFLSCRDISLQLRNIFYITILDTDPARHQVGANCDVSCRVPEVCEMQLPQVLLGKGPEMNLRDRDSELIGVEFRQKNRCFWR